MRGTESVRAASYVEGVALTEGDLEQVAVELIDIGEFVVTKAADGQSCVWQVHARKFAFNQHDGQFVELRSAARTNQRAVSGIRAEFEKVALKEIAKGNF